MRLKILRDGNVLNVIEATPEWAVENFPGCQVVEDRLPEPAVQEPARRPRILSKLEFRRRFTRDELLRFDSPELFVSGLTDVQRAGIRTMQRNFEAAQFIDLDDPLVADGLAAMVSFGLLSPQRAQEILGG